MTHRNLYSWKAILDAHVDSGLNEEACFYFVSLLNNEECGLEFVFPVVLKACSGLGAVELGKQVHGMVIKYGFVGNLYVGNALVDMYACAANEMAYDALCFLEMLLEFENLTPNVISWSAVIGGFSQNGYDREAMELMSKMLVAGVKPNERTLASVLPACARLTSLTLGQELHGYIVRHGYLSNSFVVNELVDVYRKCFEMGTAFKIFSNYSIKNEARRHRVSLPTGPNSNLNNTMIVGYSENGEPCKARKLFDEMEIEKVNAIVFD
ncbi:hypothetical protein QQ045_025667 [Rhodiola kirilowii]